MHPIIYFLTNTLNPLSVDWLGETEYNGLVDRLAHDFKQHKPVLIAAKTPYWWPLAVSPKRTCKDLSQTYEEYETGFSKTFSTNQSMFLTSLIRTWTPIDEGKYFCVFLHPSLKN
ncbi:MAG: hypothetical protein HY072_07180 [Deltaproteobacteria bacterium]|nr:hypothetical protein [Deltaproteobacteria bacterium]